MHPGGLELTDRLADLAGVGIDTRLLDAGCGHGSSAVHLASTRGCDVTGVTLEPAGIKAARARAASRGVRTGVRFLNADIRTLPRGIGDFDVAIMECVLSALDRKADTLERIYDVLEPGGRIALSDVTVTGELPEPLSGVIAAALCVADARSLDQYRALVTGAGFEIEHAEDVPGVASEFLDRLHKSLMMADIAVGLGKLDMQRSTIEMVRRILKSSSEVVREGKLGYCVIVAQKPAA